MMPGGVPFAVDRFRCTAPARRCDGSYPCCPTALHPLRHVRSASALYRTRSTCQRAPPAASDGLQGYLRPPIDIAAGLIRAALPPCSYQGASTVLLPCTAPDRHRRGSYPPGIARRRRAALTPFSYQGAFGQSPPCTASDRRIRGHCPPPACCPSAFRLPRRVQRPNALRRTRSAYPRALPARRRAALPPCTYQGASTVLLSCTVPDRHRRGSYPPGIARPPACCPSALRLPRRVRTASALYSTRSTKISRRGDPRRDIFV